MNAIIISETIKKQYNMKKIIYSVLMLATMACTFTSCEDVPLPYGWPFVSDGGGGETPEVPADAVGTGTADDPFNAVAANYYASQLGAGEESPNDVYIKGKIVKYKEEFSTQYGNATFWISDDGEDENTFYVFRTLYLGNVKYSSGDKPQVGDEVVICGKVTNYQGNTPETVQNKSYIYSINGQGGGDTPATETLGTIDNPISIKSALDIINNLPDNGSSDKQAYLSGKVTRIKTTAENIAKYHNIDYIINDGTGEITVFRGKNLNNTDFNDASELKEGDEVTVLGYLTKYVDNNGNVIPEMAQGNYIVKKGGGGTPPPSGEAKGDGTEGNPYNAVAANNAASALAAGAESDEVYVEGIISSIKEVSTQYGNGTYYISDDGKTDNQFYIFRGKYLNNENFTSTDQIKVGDKVVVKGKLLNYQGNTPEFAQGNYIVKLEPGEGGGGGGDTPGTGGEVSGNTITVTMSSFGLANATDAGTLTLTDGTTLAFAGGENTNNSPKFYDGGGGAVRMYAKNTLTISAQKAITKVVITCTDPASGTVYNGNDMMYGEAGGKRVTVKKDSDTQVTFSDFSSKSLFICNDHTEAKAGTQLRILKMVITYAE